jgi:hypothetical protein
MARDGPLDDGLTKTLFSGVSRPRPWSQKPESKGSGSTTAFEDGLELLGSDLGLLTLSYELRLFRILQLREPLAIHNP